ncbi:hypothetical protein LCGC14_1552130 [marine sediment metagenome]|uniref:Uncharacterized protein n=1 Tax=marine sediment metagenome TaxID=412755 RepID=A0A0F9LQT2_9ZZZZ
MIKAFFVYILLAVTCFAAWLTHVIVTIKAAAWILLLSGAIFAPIGIVHGISIWFGASWV